MKKILHLLFTVLLASFYCTAQETSQPVLNKSNRIILHFDDTTGLFIQVGRILIDRGYDIEMADRELGVLRTKGGTCSSEYYHYTEMKTIFRDSTITIYAVNHSGNIFYDVKFTQKKGYIKTTINKAWQEMMTIAGMLKPKTITYSRFEGL